MMICTGPWFFSEMSACNPRSHYAAGKYHSDYPVFAWREGWIVRKILIHPAMYFDKAGAALIPIVCRTKSKS
jgi:dTDP-D-glucose 4,6-dehydratase